MAGVQPAAKAWSGFNLSDATNSTEGAPDIVDWAHFERCRAELGPGFIRILSYFREDGAKLMETTARLCIETQRFPDELVRDVVELKRLFEETVAQFDKATNPLLTRSPQGAFGRKANTFGRL